MMCDQVSGKPLTVTGIEVHRQIDRRIRHKRTTKAKILVSKISNNKERKYAFETQSKIFYSVGIRKFLARCTEHIESQGNLILQHDMSYLLFHYFSNNSSQLPIERHFFYPPHVAPYRGWQ
jgi:hypothetical protein